MLFNTVEFLIFFGIVLVIYWILPEKVKAVWLLAASYYFYMQWNPRYILLILFITTVAYAGGIWIERISENFKVRKIVFILCLVICLGTLGIFKYADMGIRAANRLIGLTGGNPISWTSSLILPVGISFYTLQSLGYLIDIYMGEIYAEKNYFKFALFVSFFPQLVAGPIERSKNLLKQLSATPKFSYENLRKGFLWILWGMFLKVVIADRAAIFVDRVYADYHTYSGLYIVLATVLFSIQIYCDFHGYSTIARGTALTMGYSLTENFKAPYFSQSIKEFWRRWHISLSSWFRDYLYIPLGGNRKGIMRKNVNLLAVFSISGLWHGAALSYVFWGFLNGIYQVVSGLSEPIKKKISFLFAWKEKTPEKILKTCVTFVLVSFAWLFFRAGGFRKALDMLKYMVWGHHHNFNILFDESIYSLGISRKHFSVLWLSIIVLFAVDYRKYKGLDVADELLAQHFWFRFVIEIVLLFAILLFGCYGELYDAASFIYFQF